MSLLVNVVNVFVDERGRHGNPLGIVWTSPATVGQEQQIAADLGFSETIFIDAITAGEASARIFTPASELPFAGHPTVGLAAWLRSIGDDITAITVPAGTADVRIAGSLVFVSAKPEWTPAFEFERLASADEVLAVDAEAYDSGLFFVWAWSDERAGRIRARMFAPALGIAEDEATGAAAVRLSAELGRDLDITQGHGSRIHARSAGDRVEVGGRVSEARVVELR